MQYQTATLEQVRQHAIDHRRTHSDEVVSSKSLLMDPKQPGRIVIRRPNSTTERSFAFSKRVYRQAPLVIPGIPGGYLEKLVEHERGDANLASLNFNHWVGVGDPKDILLRFGEIEVTDENGSKKKEHGIRAMLPDGWNPVPYDKALETLIARFTPEREVKYYLTENAIAIDLITKQLERRKDGGHRKVDDIVEYGFRYEDSDVGSLPMINIGPYTLRQICSNGATVRDKGIAIQIRHTGKESASLDAVLSNVRQAVEVIDGYSAFIAEKIDLAHEVPLALDEETEKPEVALNRLRREFLVTKLEEKYVREAWEIEGGTIPEMNLYRLHNAITRAGTHGEELDELSRMKLQSVGGAVLSTLGQRNHNWN